VVFNINLKTVSPIVSEVVFEIDGQRRLYRNEKEFWYEFTWPGKKQTGAEHPACAAPAASTRDQARRAVGHLPPVRVGTEHHGRQKDSDDMFTVTWQMTRRRSRS
jgi:type VI secretion system protein ImpL